MTLKELLENKAVKNEIEEAIKKTDPKNDAEWVAALIGKAKKHGIETNENEVRALLVDKMPIDEEAMETISGGRKVYADGYSDCTNNDICGIDMSCYNIYSSCHYNHTCAASYKCDILFKLGGDCAHNFKIAPEDR